MRETAFICDLLTNERKLEGQRLRDLDLIGPAVLFPVPGPEVACEDCVFRIPRGSSIEAIILELPPAKSFSGPLKVINCGFYRCTFSQIGWLLSGFHADRFRQMIGLAPS